MNTTDEAGPTDVTSGSYPSGDQNVKLKVRTSIPTASITANRVEVRGAAIRNWQRVLIAIALCTALASSAANAFAEKNDDPVEGSWYITVNLTDPFQLTFDATYSFAAGGAFTRIDGRNNAPAVGTWKRTEDDQIIFSNILFNFSNGVRDGAIAGKFSARIVNGTLTGTFTADGILGLTDFHRAGTFTGVPILAEAP